jgi:hypothetical protein
MRSLCSHIRDSETTRVHVDEIAALSDERRLFFWSSYTRIVCCWVNAGSERQKKGWIET